MVRYSEIIFLACVLSSWFLSQSIFPAGSRNPQQTLFNIVRALQQEMVWWSIPSYFQAHATDAAKRKYRNTSQKKKYIQEVLQMPLQFDWCWDGWWRLVESHKNFHWFGSLEGFSFLPFSPPIFHFWLRPHIPSKYADLWRIAAPSVALTGWSGWRRGGCEKAPRGAKTPDRWPTLCNWKHQDPGTCLEGGAGRCLQQDQGQNAAGRGCWQGHLLGAWGPIYCCLVPHKLVGFNLIVRHCITQNMWETIQLYRARYITLQPLAL